MRQEFTALIKKHDNLNGAYVEPPFDVKDIFGAKRVKVVATFDGALYRGSLVSVHGCYMLGLTQEIREKIGKNFGDYVTVTVEKDEEDRTIETPDDFMEALKHDGAALNVFERLPFSGKKEYVRWINRARKAKTRHARINKAVGRLSEKKQLV